MWKHTGAVLPASGSRPITWRVPPLLPTVRGGEAPLLGGGAMTFTES